MRGFQCGLHFGLIMQLYRPDYPFRVIARQIKSKNIANINQ